MSVWGTIYRLERDRATGADPDSLRAENARLRAEVELWKDRYEAECQAHEATTKHYEKILTE